MLRLQPSPTKVAAFTDEATSGDYDNVLQACMRWVDGVRG